MKENCNLIENQLQKFNYRSKRGLINGLGSVIKYITGNPDDQDLIKISENLESLYNSQGKIIKQINSQTSFANLITNRYSKDLKAIHESLNSSFTAINNISSSLDTETMVQYYNLVSLRLINTLQIIERTISLAFSEITNLELFSHEELMEIINHLKLVYRKTELLELDYVHAFKLLEFSKFRIVSAKDTITCILYIPILKSSLFRYTKIYPIPDLQSKVLIPPYKYHLQGTTEEFWTDERCKQIEKQAVCVEKPRVHKCAIKNLKNCTIAIANNNYELYTQLNNGKILVSCKISSRVIEECSNNIENFEFANSALISSKDNCKIVIGEKTFERSYSNFTFKSPLEIGNYNAESTINLQLKHLEDLPNLKEEANILENEFYINPALQATHIFLTILIIISCIIGITCFVFKHKIRLVISSCKTKVEEHGKIQDFNQGQKNADVLA